MKIFQKIYRLISKTSIAFCCFLAVSLLYGCKDDLLLVEDDPVSGASEKGGDCLAFTIEMPKELSSRAGTFSKIVDGYDNYIDTQDKFRVFFFTENGDFLFGATDRVASSLIQSTSGTTSMDYWYVRIPMTMIVDRNNKEYNINKIKDYLKNHPFKIAVLANWPNAGDKVNPADYDDSEGGQVFGENPSSELKGHPLWNWNNSILNEQTVPDSIRNINDLHHVYRDLYYGAASRSSVYGDFMASVTSGNEPGLYAGEPTDWVKMRDVEADWQNPDGIKLNEQVKTFSSQSTANQWIRANWTPAVSPNHKKKIYRHYQHMWFLWNFDATYKYGQWLESDEGKEADGEAKKAKADEFYGKNWGWNDGSPVPANEVNPFGVEWFDRNGGGTDEEGHPMLYEWMKKGNTLSKLYINIGESNNDVFFQYTPRTGNPVNLVKVGENYGIQLPVRSDQLITVNDDCMLTFQARTSGTLRVKWGSADASTNSTLAVQVNTTKYKHENYRSTAPTDWTANGYSYWDITVEGNSVPIHIFSTQGKAVVYSIEFIRGRYLYETDREGVAPGLDQGIPMYGVQKYKPIGDWQRGTTYNLSDAPVDDDGYGGNVYLIRALAKVEVYIKKEFGDIRHMYMRYMNRAARCEPMDVHSPTETIWNDQHYSGDNGNNCEWFDIIGHKPAFTSDSKDYYTWLSWFYGSWKDSDCFWKTEGEGKSYKYSYEDGYFKPDGRQAGWQKGSFTSYGSSPHLFNPYIYRSDFCRFLEDESTYTSGGETYNRFVLYLPEENIADPATAGNLSSTPRIPHIEYRFYPTNVDPNNGELISGVVSDEPSGADADRYSNSEYNLDDNDCFRIYFTNYGTSSGEAANSLGGTNANPNISRYSRDGYDVYEREVSNLDYHWPIMRNHCYKFYVGGASPENPEIKVEVSDWGHRKVVVEW